MGKREIIYLSLHCHHQTDSCIKMGSDESHFNISLIVRDKSQDNVHKPQLSRGRGRRGMKMENGVPADGGVKGKKKCRRENIR